jgi:septum formation protein
MTDSQNLNGYPLILGSSSPQRLRLLGLADIYPDTVFNPQVDESCLARENPRDYCERIAHRKADVTLEAHPDTSVLCADTIVTVGRRILQKPKDSTTAFHHLRLLSGRRHQVMTCVVLANRATSLSCSRTVVTRVKFQRLSEADIRRYVENKTEWEGRAGGYGIQGRAAAFIYWINGSHTNVEGLPLVETVNLLRGTGCRP